MIKVLGLHGSPRHGGNSELLLDEALRGAADAGAETRKIRLAKLMIAGCTECNDCYSNGECSIADDMDRVYTALEWADRIIFSSSIFFMGLPSQAKAAVDRTQRYWVMKYVLKQPFPRSAGAPPRYGVFLAVGGTRGAGLFDGVGLTIKYFFDAIDVKPLKDHYVRVRGIDKKGDIADKKSSLAAAYETGKELVKAG